MAKKGNTLTQHIRAAHHALGLANFLAFRANSSAQREASQVQKGFDGGKSGFFSTGSSIAALDIYAPEKECIAYSGTMVTGDERIKLLTEAESMAQADAIVTAYEVMEQFVKKLTAEYLYAKRGEIPIKNKLKQKTSQHFGKKKIEPENTKPWFDQLVHVLAGKNARPLFDIFFKRIEGLRERVTNFPMGDLDVIHQAVEAIRHRKTHANGRHNRDKFASLPHDVQKRIAPCIRESFLNSVEWILPSHKQTEGFIAREAEYAQILYDAVTRDLEMKLEWTPGRDPKTLQEWIPEGLVRISSR